MYKDRGQHHTHVPIQRVEFGLHRTVEYTNRGVSVPGGCKEDEMWSCLYILRYLFTQESFTLSIITTKDLECIENTWKLLMSIKCWICFRTFGRLKSWGAFEISRYTRTWLSSSRPSSIVNLQRYTRNTELLQIARTTPGHEFSITNTSLSLRPLRDLPKEYSGTD